MYQRSVLHSAVRDSFCDFLTSSPFPICSVSFDANEIIILTCSVTDTNDTYFGIYAG